MSDSPDSRRAAAAGGGGSAPSSLPPHTHVVMVPEPRDEEEEGRVLAGLEPLEDVPKVPIVVPDADPAAADEGGAGGGVRALGGQPTAAGESGMVIVHACAVLNGRWL